MSRRVWVFTKKKMEDMLNSRSFGYAVMSRELDAYAFKDEKIENCKRYCYNGYVIAEQIPYVCGFSIRIVWHSFHKLFCFKYRYYNILWLHWSVSKEYLHKTGKIVYDSKK